MDQDRLLNAIRQYCLINGFAETAKKMQKLSVGDGQTIENAFHTYFEKENKLKIFKETGLGFSIKLPTGQFRKRLRDIDITEEKLKVKKSKKENSKVKTEMSIKKEQEIPEQFFILLDELRLDRKDAKLLFENREHWAYVKSDRQIFCVERGCNFARTMAADCLAEHCKTKHDWRKRQCTYDGCKFEAYSSYSFKAGFIIWR